MLRFLVLGGLLLAVFRSGSPPTTDDRKIVVTLADKERFAAAFARTWHHRPDPQELRTAVEEHIREELLYRAALSLGLDRDDTIIRRRLRQKMEFLFEDTMPLPREAELRAWFHQHEERFRREPQVSLRQVFSASRGSSAEANAAQLLTRLVAGRPEAADDGDPWLLGDGFDAAPLSRIGALFAVTSRAR